MALITAMASLTPIEGGDTVDGDTLGSVSAVALASADASAIVQAIAEAPVSESLTAFAGAIATSLSRARIVARAINNQDGTVTTGQGKDTISAAATSSSATLSQAATNSLAIASPENQALAQAVAEAVAEASDRAIAIDNSEGSLRTGDGGDTINATAEASDLAIAILNIGGVIRTGDKGDTIVARATGVESYGIFGGDLLTGSGADRVEASGFGGGVNIRMGRGQDFVEGFGDASLNGGRGMDTLSLGTYSRSDFSISLGSEIGDAMFELGGITMATTSFEQFTFADGSYSYEQLMSGFVV